MKAALSVAAIPVQFEIEIASQIRLRIGIFVALRKLHALRV